MSFALKNRLVTARNAAAAVAAVALMLAGQAYAAVPADVTTALEEAKTDAMTVGGLVLVVIIAIAAFKFIRRAI
jgi:hypothetical protein